MIARQPSHHDQPADPISWTCALGLFCLSTAAWASEVSFWLAVPCLAVAAALGLRAYQLGQAAAARGIAWRTTFERPLTWLRWTAYAWGAVAAVAITVGMLAWLGLTLGALLRRLGP